MLLEHIDWAITEHTRRLKTAVRSLHSSVPSWHVIGKLQEGMTDCRQSYFLIL
jgi:hypothetical protein